MMENRLHIYEKLNKFRFKTHLSMHMPGHKSKASFRTLFPSGAIDTTELSYSDDLQNPSGIIDDAQKDIAALLGAKQSFILTDGSTCGIMSMLYVARKHGTKILIPRNSHKSVYNACKLFGLEPIMIQGQEVNGILQPPSPELVATIIVNDVSVGGMLAISPDYYGNVSPLGDYARILHDNGRLLLVDGAHGAHLAFGSDRPLHASNYADIWVDGAHKTLPTLTQGAVLSCNNEALTDEVKEALDIFRTTSPSYPVMASVEYGVKYVAENEKAIERLKQAIADFCVNIVGYGIYHSADWAKLVIDCKPVGIDSLLVQDFLEKRNIFIEMADGRYLLCYLSPLTEPNDINELRNALNAALGQKRLRGTYVQRQPFPVNDRSYSFQFALKQPKEWVPLDEALGRMCAGNCGITPPCIPVVAIGEIVNERAVRLLKNNPRTFGLKDGKILVVKK